MKSILLCAVTCGALWLPATAGAKPPASPDMSGKQEHAMRNCPSTVAGASTTVEDRKDGVAVTVTAGDPIAVREIQRRAALQSTVAAQPARGAIEHTGEGTGSGRYGFCPGMVAGTLVTVDKLTDGARLVVRPRAQAEIATLQRSTHERLKRLEAKR